MFTHKTNVAWGISPMILLVGLLYQFISFAFPHWLENNECYVGLWKSGCFINDEKPANLTVLTEVLETISTWRLATQVLQCFTIVCAAVSVLSAIARIQHGRPTWQSVCAGSAFVCGLFSVVSCIVFAITPPRPDNFSLSWAFALNLISGSFCLLASPCIYLDVRWRASV